MAGHFSFLEVLGGILGGLLGAEHELAGLC